MTTADQARTLRQLHDAHDLLVLVNVWDVVSATVVAGLPGCRALATASHSIAASAGYPDGEVIPREEMLSVVGRIVAAVDLPVTADLEAGYGDPAETVRRAIGVGIAGANLEDQMKPLSEAVAAVEAAVTAGDAEGVPFVLNARTDAFLSAGERPRPEVLAEATSRGRAYVQAGASVVFVPGLLSATEIEALVDGIGPVSLIAVPGAVPLAQMQALGVRRVSTGPWTQRIALTALAEAGAAILAGAGIPDGTRALN